MLYDAEKKRVARLPISGANAMELVLQANRSWDQDRSPKGTITARKLYEEALRRDPDSVPALLGLYWTKDWEVFEGVTPATDQVIKELDDLSKRALSLDRSDPRVWAARTESLMYEHQWDRALEANAAALQIDPYSEITVNDRGFLLLVTGRPEEALPVLDRAIALDPTGPLVHGHLQLQCSAHLNLGHYDQAIAACEKALALDDYWLKYVFLLGAYAQKGDMAKAEATKVELLKRKPDVSIARLKSTQPVWANPLYQQQREAHLYAGLRKVGIPE
jgi:tetratricopeptide (TPR) repeat protein